MSNIAFKFCHFNASYVQNRPIRRVRSIRCFPYCGKSHRDNEHCREPFILEISNTSEDLSGVIIIAEFKPVEGEFRITSPTSLDHVLMMRNTRKNPTHPLFFGNISQVDEERDKSFRLSKQTLTVVFNNDSRIIHHSWEGDSKNQSMMYVFGITLLTKQEIMHPDSNITTSQLCPFAHFSSPSFTINPIGRRTRPTMRAQAPTNELCSSSLASSQPTSSESESTINSALEEVSGVDFNSISAFSIHEEISEFSDECRYSKMMRVDGNFGDSSECWVL